MRDPIPNLAEDAFAGLFLAGDDLARAPVLEMGGKLFGRHHPGCVSVEPPRESVLGVQVRSAEKPPSRISGLLEGSGQNRVGGVDSEIVNLDSMAQVGKTGHERGMGGQGPGGGAPGTVENNALPGQLVDVRADRKVRRIVRPMPVDSQPILAEGVDADEDHVEISSWRLAASSQQETEETQEGFHGWFSLGAMTRTGTRMEGKSSMPVSN